MRIFLFTLAIHLLTILPVSAFAQETVTEKLEQRKAEFEKTASSEKIIDYEDGVIAVRNSGVLDKAKNVGDIAPDFTLPSADGERITLSSLLKSGPVVLIWYRGEWCPYCNIYLEDIQSHIKEFKDIGAQVVAISPETPDRGWTLQDKQKIEFYVLSDQGSKVAQNYGVSYTIPPKIVEYYQNAFAIHEKNKDESNLLPLGASYVIDKSGKITYAFLDADYRKRAETSVLLNEVKKLSQQ